MGKLIIFLSRNKVLLFILLMGLIPLMWFRDGLLIAGGDFPIPLDPVGTLKAYLQTWFPYVFCGGPNVQQFLIFPWFGFWAFFKSLGFSLLTVNKFWFIFICMLTGLSMYYLVSVVLEKKNYQLIALTASLFYMFNVYFMLMTPLIATPILYAGLPLILGLYIKGLREEKPSTKYAILIGIASQLIVLAIDNPTIYAICGIMVFSYLIYHLVTGGKKGITRSLIFTLKTAVIFLLMNLWWIYPEFLALIDISKNVQLAASSVSFLTSTTLLDALRFLGSWAWKGSYMEMPYFPYALNYDQSPLVFLTYLIPAFCFFCLLFAKKVKREILFLELVFVIGLFLVKGILSPFGKIYSFLFRHFPGFWIFREPYSKFTLINVFSLACLLGLGFVFLIQEIREKKFFLKRPKFATALTIAIWLPLIGIILYNSYPFLTGEVVFDGHYKVMRSWYAKIPGYWEETKNWLNINNAKDWRLFILPKAGYSHAYNWEVGMSTGGPVAHVLQEKPIVFYSSSPTSVTEELVNKTYDSLNFKRNDQLISALSLLNVKYLLQQNDLDYNNQLSISTFSPEEIKKILALYPEIKKAASFGQLDIYQIKENFLKPKIFVPSQIVYSEVKLVDLIDFKLPFLLNDSLVFYRDDLTEEQKERVKSMANWRVISPSEIVASSSALGEINFKEGELTSFQKVNPTDYRVALKDSPKPFFLVFSETFNNKWKAYFGKTEISEKNHFKVNGFSNAWLIERPDNLKIEIKYSGQKLLTIAYLISGISIVLGFIVLALNVKPKRD